MSESATIAEPITSAPKLTGAELDQYHAVRNGGAGWRELTGRGLIEVSGTEAVPFLNGMITNDVKTLEDGQWMSAAFPNVQGRLIAYVRVLNRGGAYLFETEAATHGPVFQALHRFTFAGDFKVADLTETHTLFTVQGAGAPATIEQLLNAEAANIARNQVLTVTGAAGTATVIRATHTAEDGFDFLVDGADAKAFRTNITSSAAVRISDPVWEVLRIEAGIPRFGIDMTATNVVLETVPEDAVSYTKGCYVGQEIIARIHCRGPVAKKLAGLELDGPASHDEQLVTAEGKDAGRITSVAYSPALDQWVALGMVKYDQLAAGTELKIGTADSERTATAAALPLVTGSWSKSEPNLPVAV
jgi:folate-binding protein YgfZ